MRATHGASRAWRAGCRETGTSGSARGAQKPVAARRRGAACLLYCSFSGRDHRGLDGDRWTGGRSACIRRTEAKRRMAAPGFFVSRCKAAGGGKKLGAAIAGRRSRHSRSPGQIRPREAAWPRPQNGLEGEMRSPSISRIPTRRQGPPRKTGTSPKVGVRPRPTRRTTTRPPAFCTVRQERVPALLDLNLATRAAFSGQVPAPVVSGAVFCQRPHRPRRNLPADRFGPMSRSALTMIRLSERGVIDEDWPHHRRVRD